MYMHMCVMSHCVLLEVAKQQVCMSVVYRDLCTSSKIVAVIYM